jgi:hypothetical protein
MDIVKHYEELLEMDPSSPVFENLAQEFCLRGLWAEAARVCRQGLSFHPQHLRGRLLLGWASKELGEIGDAEKVLLEAAGEIRKNALVFKLLGEIAESAGDTDRAESLIDIFQNLRASAFEQPVPSEAQTIATPEDKDEKPSTASVLASLLERFEAETTRVADTQRIFTDEDRQRLIQILRSRKH